MAQTIEERMAAVEAKLAALEAEATPPPPETVICTDCLTDIPIEDAELYADPDQGGATRYRCKLRTPCKARIKEAADHAERMRQEAEARHAAARETLIEEARRRLREEKAREGGEA